MSGTGRGEPLWLRDEGRGLHTQECGRMGAGRAGPAARAWFLVCVSGGSCVCRLLGPAGVPCTEHRVTGNPASTLWLSPTPSVQAAYPWTGRGCVRRRATPLSCRSRACLGSAGAGAGAPLSGRAGCCASGSQSCFPDGCPAGSLCTQECGERGPATPPHPPPATQLGFPTPAPASAPSGAQWDPC